MQTARANREAEVAVFILSASHLPDGFPAFSRYGKDLLFVRNFRTLQTPTLTPSFTPPYRPC